MSDRNTVAVLRDENSTMPDHSSATMRELSRVREYWNQYVIGIEITDKEIGTKGFFHDLENYYRDFGNDSHLLDYNRYKGKKLLEVGCGWGDALMRFAEGGAEVTGVDLSESAINLAKKYFEHKNLPANLRVGNAEELEFKDGEFDVAVSTGVLHHTPDTQKGIDELYRVLKPNGEAVVMLYNKYSWYNFLCVVSGTNFEHQEKDAPIVKLYSKGQVLEMFRKFRKVEVDITRAPAKTIKRNGLLSSLYNNAFVPLYSLMPTRLTKPFGFHIIIRAIK